MRTDIIKINEKEYVLRNGKRAIFELQKYITEETLQIEVEYIHLYCMLKVYNQDFNYSLNDFLDVTDGQEVLQPYHEYLNSFYVPETKPEDQVEAEDDKKKVSS